MKIIFSRKGFDSAAGGCPSPLVNGRPISLPIPTRQPSAKTYGDLVRPLPALVSNLTGGRLDEKTPCHLDPDLDAGALALRLPGWKAALGQVGAAQGHLRNQGVGVGDIFVFWGLFQPASLVDGVWRFTGKPRHAIFGWLQIGEVLPLGTDGSWALLDRSWLRDHPHTRPGWPDSNALYVASAELVLDGRTGLPGAGHLQRAYDLSDPESRGCSIWRVPSWLNPSTGGTGLTFHPPTRWLSDGRLWTAPRGQEFVADVGRRADALEWVTALVEDHR